MITTRVHHAARRCGRRWAGHRTRAEGDARRGLPSLRSTRHFPFPARRLPSWFERCRHCRRTRRNDRVSLGGGAVRAPVGPRRRSRSPQRGRHRRHWSRYAWERGAQRGRDGASGLQKTASRNVLVRHGFLRTGASLLSYLVAIICACPRVGKERDWRCNNASRLPPFSFSQDWAARSLNLMMRRPLD